MKSPIIGFSQIEPRLKLVMLLIFVPSNSKQSLKLEGINICGIVTTFSSQTLVDTTNYIILSKTFSMIIIYLDVV